ncbi:unnamed protein product [Chrysoparadoxa australica]
MRAIVVFASCLIGSARAFAPSIASGLTVNRFASSRGSFAGVVTRPSALRSTAGVDLAPAPAFDGDSNGAIALDPAPVAQGTRRVKKEANFVIEGDSMENTPFMVALTTTFFLLDFLFIGFGLSAATSIPGAAMAAAAAVGGVMFADAFTGFFHWSVDNYGGLETPVLGTVIAAFQGHHDTPWTITYRPLANNVHKICIPALALLGMMALAGVSGPGAVFGGFALMSLVLCQETHKYSHMVSPPPLMRFLQDTGLVLTKKQHGLHHSSPFESNYCIVNGMCNEALDAMGTFRFLEGVVFRLTGEEPNCWKLDPTGQHKAIALDMTE